MLNGTVKTFNIKPSYINKDPNSQYREFQLELKKAIDSSNNRIVILNAPTGAGKTFAFREIKKDGRIMIVLPNNLLSEEVNDGIGNMACLLNKQKIDEHIHKVYRDQNANCSKAEAIEQMVIESDYIITNPTVFFFILSNHYTQNAKDDMISRILKYKIDTIIFDEFHIYTLDQLYKILAAAVILPKKVKIMFSSATVPDYFGELCKNIFGQESVTQINVKRSYEKNNNNTILQGLIKLHIFNGSAEELIENNKEIIKSGKWAMILDSIRSIERVGQVLSKELRDEEYGLLAAYYDPDYHFYKATKEINSNLRIVVSSNVIEQGININPSFSNFIIEPGVGSENLIQRIGRVGRGIEQESVVYLCIPNGVYHYGRDIQNMDELIDFISSLNFTKKARIPRAFGVGVYAYLLLEKLTIFASSIIENNIIKSFGNNLKAGYWSSKNVCETMENKEGVEKIKKNCFREIIELKEWWDKYKETIYDFIPKISSEVNVLDESFNLNDEFLKTRYNEIWIKKNKNILYMDGNNFVVGNFNEKVNYDFYVRISNLPLGKRRMRYGDIAFKSHEKIIEDLEKLLDETDCKNNTNFMKFINDVIECTKVSAGVERLILEVDYDQS
ncbi:type I-D CRISPR-associated helicase Cas3' [Cuniculiplasma sp. SKW3]|uniref:type I-D CRISPR-associated helicase Cas3' n=1 Tax=Cuniculiplasma sp. SKW3 TaxID=3400170 RepID=UPI003FD19BC1